MALITCNECGKEISELADICPNCGCPNQYKIKKDTELLGRNLLRRGYEDEAEKYRTKLIRAVKCAIVCFLLGFSFCLFGYLCAILSLPQMILCTFIFALLFQVLFYIPSVVVNTSLAGGILIFIIQCIVILFLESLSLSNVLSNIVGVLLIIAPIVDTIITIFNYRKFKKKAENPEEVEMLN